MASSHDERDIGVPIQFWYEFASTYSYPAAMRVESVAADGGVRVQWCPFLLGPIFAAQGWKDSPFNLYPAKGRYMWRDLERICEAQGLRFRRPSVFPRNGLLAARLACVGLGEGWCAEFTRRVYVANFGEDREISRTEVLAEVLAELGLDAASLLERASGEAIKSELRERTEHGAALGIFGAPTLVSGTEMFWGNDRLDTAVAWHRKSAAA